MNKGWKQGKSLDDIQMMLELKTNVAVFSAFKSHSQGAEYVNILVDDNGDKRSWGEFRKLAVEIDREYNRNWLATEYNMATRQARAAEQWTNFVRDEKVYPNLEYMPSQSADPSDEHMQYYGIIKPVNDPFWDTALPPSRWGCKCWVRQTKADPTDQDVEPPVPLPGIEGNPGKSGRVFSATSPFVAAKSKKDKELIRENLRMLRNRLTDHVEMKVGKQKIRVHVNADWKDLTRNLNNGELMAKELKRDIEILEHIEGVPGKKNPEYRIGGVIADRVQFDGENLRDHVSRHFTKKAGQKGQMKDFDECIIIFDLLGKLDEQMVDGLVGQLNSKMKDYSKVSSVIFINNGKVLEVKRGFDIVKLQKNIKGKLI